MTRREFREETFKLLFFVEFNEISELEDKVNLYFANKREESIEKGKAVISDEEQESLITRFNSIVEILPEINNIISENTSGWSIDRIGKVELTLIRLAVYEIRFDEDIPNTVAINEAVQLAKKYGQDGAGAFVNGVLAKII